MVIQVYIFWLARKIVPPPPVEILPCFLGLLLRVSSNSSVFLVLLQILPCFSIWRKLGGGMARIYNSVVISNIIKHSHNYP